MEVNEIVMEKLAQLSARDFYAVNILVGLAEKGALWELHVPVNLPGDESQNNLTDVCRKAFNALRQQSRFG